MTEHYYVKIDLFFITVGAKNCALVIVGRRYLILKKPKSKKKTSSTHLVADLGGLESGSMRRRFSRKTADDLDLDLDSLCLLLVRGI